MSISARKFLDRLAERGLLEEQVVQQFRAHIEQSLFEVPCDAVAKLLVDKGHLTSFQASKLVTEVTAEVEAAEAGGGAASAAKKPAPGAPAAGASAKPVPNLKTPPKPEPIAAHESDSLGLADLGDGGPGAGGRRPGAAAAKAAPPEAKPAAPAKKEPAPAEDIVMLEDAETATSAKKSSSPSSSSGAGKSSSKPSSGKSRGERPASKSGSPRSAAAGLAPLDEGNLATLPDQGLTPLGDFPGGMDPGMAGGANADPFAAGGLGAAAGMPQPAAAAAPGFKKVQAKSWHSTSFIYWIGGTIAVIALLPFMWYVLSRGTGSEMFGQAEALYKSASYTQAISMYDKFLKEFPSDPNVSLAKVRRGLAMIRSVSEGSKDNRQALSQAQEVIPQIAVEDRFAEARPELTGILPGIAQGLARQAKDAGTGKAAKDFVKLAEEAMELVMDSNNIPAQLRTPIQSTIDDISRTITEANRNIRQAEQLVVALEGMEKALADKDSGQAFEIRRVLLREFPGLEFNDQMMAIVLRVAAAERDQVQLTTQDTLAVTDDHPKAQEAQSLLLAHRRGDANDAALGHIAFILARGSVYGIDVATGKILWRRFVGFETFVHPQPVVPQTQAADALVADALHQEIARVEAKTGKLVWRLPIGEQFAKPVIVGERVFVTTLSGRVIEADLATGKSSRSIKLPQGTTVELGATTQLPNAFQAGAHSNLYVLNVESLSCKEAYYLGHKAGTIAVPPVAVLNHVLVAENAGTDYALIHVVATDDNGLKLERPADQEPIRVQGNVTAPLIKVKNRIIVTTDRAAFLVLEVDKENKRKPVKTIAARSASEMQSLPSQVVAEGAQLWIANDRFVALDIQASREQLAPKWVKHEQEIFVSPLQKFGSTIVHVRRRRGSPGLTVSASKPDSGNLIWQTDLAMPLTYVGVDSDKNQVVVINAQGELFRLTKEAIDAGYLDQPTETAEVAGSATTFALTEAAAVDDKRVALVSEVDPSSAVLFDPRRTGDELAVVRLDVGGSPINTMPIPLGGGLAATTEAGGVWWLSVETGKSLGLPFQPKLGPAEKIHWNRAALLPGGKELVVCDGRQRVYRIAVKDQPNPHLLGVAEGPVPEPLLGSLAVGGAAAFGWSRGSSNDVIRIFPLPGLTEAQEQTLTGRVYQGPWSSTDAAYVVTDQGDLVALTAGPQPKWSIKLPDGPLAGPPRRDGDTLWASSIRGTLLKISAETGEIQSKTELREPLGGAPVSFGSRLLVPGADGVLYATK